MPISVQVINKLLSAKTIKILRLIASSEQINKPSEIIIGSNGRFLRFFDLQKKLGALMMQVPPGMDNVSKELLEKHGITSDYLYSNSCSIEFVNEFINQDKHYFSTETQELIDGIFQLEKTTSENHKGWSNYFEVAFLCNKIHSFMPALIAQMETNQQVELPTEIIAHIITTGAIVDYDPAQCYLEKMEALQKSLAAAKSQLTEIDKDILRITLTQRMYRREKDIEVLTTWIKLDIAINDLNNPEKAAAAQQQILDYTQSWEKLIKEIKQKYSSVGAFELLIGRINTAVKSLLRQLEESGAPVAVKEPLTHTFNTMMLLTERSTVSLPAAQKAKMELNTIKMVTTEIDFATATGKVTTIDSSGYDSCEKVLLDCSATAGHTYKFSRKFRKAAQKVTTPRAKIKLLSQAAIAVAQCFSKTDISPIVGKSPQAEYPLDLFVEQGAGVCRHHAMLLAKMIGDLVKYKKIPNGQVIRFRGNSFELQGHNAVMYYTSNELYLIDSSAKGPQVFNLRTLSDHHRAIAYYRSVGLDGFLMHAFMNRTYNLECPTLPPLSAIATDAMYTAMDGNDDLEETLQKENLICPISGGLSVDPVRLIDLNGKSYYYNRVYLQAWFAKNGTNPLTNLPLAGNCKVVPGVAAVDFTRYIWPAEDNIKRRLWEMVWKHCKLLPEEAIAKTRMAAQRSITASQHPDLISQCIAKFELRFQKVAALPTPIPSLSSSEKEKKAMVEFTTIHKTEIFSGPTVLASSTKQQTKVHISLTQKVNVSVGFWAGFFSYHNTELSLREYFKNLAGATDSISKSKYDELQAFLVTTASSLELDPTQLQKFRNYLGRHRGYPVGRTTGTQILEQLLPSKRM